MTIIKEGIFNSTLFKRNEEKFIKMPGIWSCEFRYQGKVFMTKKFLVLPKIEEFENGREISEIYKNFEIFWKHNSICVKSIENQDLKISYFHSKFFKSCFDSTQWSTFYPDPKSDLEENFGLDFKSRKQF